MPEHGIEGVGEVDAEDLLALLDADNVHGVGMDEVGFSCLYSAGHADGDRHPSAHVNRDTLLWCCKGCGRAGNLLELVKLGLPHGTTHLEALRWLRENFGEVARRPIGGSLVADLTARLERVHAESPARILPNEAATIGPEGIFAMDWRSDHPAAIYMRGRGFSPETLDYWDVGFDAWTQRVAIPVRDESGMLVGFKGRAIDGRQPKYLLLGDVEGRAPRYGVGFGFDMHDARVVLFGLERARYYGDDVLVVCEGELDTMACHAAGADNAVATGTKSITAQQLWLMRAHASTLVFFYDNSHDQDDPAQRALWGFTDPDSKRYYPGLVEKLKNYFRILVVDDHEGDPASMAPEEVRFLVAGARHWLGLAFPSGSSV